MTASPPPDPPQQSLLDEDYNSAEDSDFDPTTSAPQDVASSSDDDSGTSGDEATGKPKSKSKSKNKKRKRIEDEEGGEGGLIKTRRQRAQEIREKAGGVAEGKVTTDVDKLWAEMNAAPVRPSSSARTTSNENSATESTPKDVPPSNGSKDKEKKEEVLQEELSATGERMVRIKRTYDFAGETITEEVLVPASSRTAASNPATTTNLPRRAPPKKRKSMFDKPADKKAAAPKINTLEKSKMDWAGFVDREGISDELQKFNKGEKGYLEQQAFLGRVDERTEEQRRAAKSS